MSLHFQDRITLPNKNIDELLQTNVAQAQVSFVNVAMAVLNGVRGKTTKHILDESPLTPAAKSANSTQKHSKCEDSSVQQEYQHLSNLPPRLSLPAETTALLIVDVQHEYWSDCPPVQKNFPDFPQNLARTIEICRKRQAKIIWIRADYRYCCSPWLPEFERIRGNRNLGEVPCDLNSPEIEWEDFAQPMGGEVVILKHSFAATSNTALLDILKASRIETVLVCGLITSVCVHHSAYGVFEAGFRTIVIQDACADRCLERHRAALQLFGDYMYDTINSTNLESEETGLVPAKPLWIVTTRSDNNNLPQSTNNNGTCCTVSSNFTAKTDTTTFVSTIVVEDRDDASVSSSVTFPECDVVRGERQSTFVA
mmetsp:Transcript_6752/g.12508  ORF Transcript_6752/g.12508 Transcript_6752/m.12508 type:complete len:368 (+) Transcript_6752:17-1120(+)